MKRLLPRLVFVFLAATLAPFGISLWVAGSLLEQSLEYGAVEELDRLSRLVGEAGRAYYQMARTSLREDAEAGRLKPVFHRSSEQDAWPAQVKDFWTSEAGERFYLSEAPQQTLHYLRRVPGGAAEYARQLPGPDLKEIERQYRSARELVSGAKARDLRKGLITTLVLAGFVIWGLAAALLVYFASRITRPVRALHQGLARLAEGHLDTRVSGDSQDEIGDAIRAFNHMAEQLRQSRERLLYLTRLAGWQSLARKMAHELKNSLTPIRLNVEEIVARSCEADRPLVEPAAQIVIEEIASLQRRVESFSQFAAEPEVRPADVDLVALVEERLLFLQSSNRGTRYEFFYPERPLECWCDPDLVKSVLNNLLKNAAQAAGPGGSVRLRLGRDGPNLVWLEVHDSGPGLSCEARQTLFEPTISFKPGGMGLGLSISKRSALLCGGDLELVEGELGGAAFRLTLPSSAKDAGGGSVVQDLPAQAKVSAP